MTICDSCLSLSKKSFRLRFIIHYPWSILPLAENLPDKPHSSRVFTKTILLAIIDLDGEEKFCQIVNMAIDIHKDYLGKFPPQNRKSGSSSSLTASLPSFPSESSGIRRRRSSSSSSLSSSSFSSSSTVSMPLYVCSRS